MVAISLYRGELHDVPNVPRRWPIPAPKISLKNFKSLLQRRSVALSRLRSEPDDVPDSSPDAKREEAPNTPQDTVNGDANLPVEFLETTKELGVLDEKEERKRVVEKKLEVQKAKKHNLVLLLKQILSVEEELKGQNCMPMANHPTLPILADATNDSGSMTRQISSRIVSEANIGGDIGRGETDDVSNPNGHSLRMSSTSPSSASHLGRGFSAQRNGVLQASSRASPSRFGQQGHPLNLPPVSVSGTNYIMSSPSPAASGGTSVFRENRLQSPWN